MKRKKKEFRYLLDLKELKSGLEEQMEKLALYIQPENKKEVLKMTVKEIVEKVNRMILSKDSEEYEWLYDNVVTPALCTDYVLTTEYIKQISKEHMLELAAGMDVVIKYFNKVELADLIKEKYYALIGNDGDIVDKETIDSLYDFLH